MLSIHLFCLATIFLNLSSQETLILQNESVIIIALKWYIFSCFRVNIIRNISPHVQGFSFHIFWAYTGIEGFVQGFLYLMGVDIRTVRCSFQTSLWTALAGRIRLLCTKI